VQDDSVTLPALRRLADAAVVLPGSGSDEVFVHAVFGPPLAAEGLQLVAPPPRHGPRLAEHHLSALDAAAQRHGRIVVGGISLGAHLAAEWAAANPDRCAGLLLAMPGWTGAAADSPGAVTAALAAASVAADGATAAIASAVRDVPAWLAAELARAWQRAGADLAPSLRVAEDRPAPTADALRTITAPAGVVACTGDPVHPVEVATSWADALPHAALRTITFAELGADRAALGRAALVGLAAAEQDQVADHDADDHGRGAPAQHQRRHHGADRDEQGEHGQGGQPRP
jgi:pimeloyl-ACP methyl ester carboxylesterase